MEVEAVLQRHPAVSSCVVVPMRQSETISRVKAVITPRDPAHPPLVEELRQFAREHLTSYKVPRAFEIRNSLPRSATGKVLRHLVQA
jgi:acyl-coenzyme A synthetase/AMP-(fatty) acid ligase